MFGMKMFRIKTILLALLFSVVPLLAVAAPTAPIPIKVVVISMFEHGEITGDRPG